MIRPIGLSFSNFLFHDILQETLLYVDMFCSSAPEIVSCNGSCGQTVDEYWRCSNAKKTEKATDE